MEELEELNFGVPVKTQVWLAQAAIKGLEKHRKKKDRQGKFMMKLRRFAVNGFVNYEGGDGCDIQHEWDGVYRVGDGTLFRLIGFYESATRECFLGFDTFLKRGNDLSAAQRQRIKDIASIRKSGDWRKKQNGYPRIAE